MFVGLLISCFYVNAAEGSITLKEMCKMTGISPVRRAVALLTKESRYLGSNNGCK